MTTQTNGHPAVMPTEIGRSLLSQLSPQERDILRNRIAIGASDSECELFLRQARAEGLNPWAMPPEVWLIPRRQQVNGQWVTQYVPQTGRDGALKRAKQRGVYQTHRMEHRVGGQWYADGDEPDDAEHPDRSRCTIPLPGTTITVSAVVRWKERAQYNRDGGLTETWKRMPYDMLAKCFDPETEVLTTKGFERFPEVSGRVLQVTEHGLEACDARPFFQAWDGDMVTLESDDLNFSVTPNHELLTTDGKLEAGTIYAAARSRPRHWIPRAVTASRPDAPVSDQELRLTAAYLSDGADRSGSAGFVIPVARERKIAELRVIGGAASEREGRATGSPGRGILVRIPTRVTFAYHREQVAYLCPTAHTGKRIAIDRLLTLSRRQARLLVDTLIWFDGHRQTRTGVRRFYTSNPEHLAAFEIAAAIGGYTVSPRRSRLGGLSPRPNFYLTVSSRSEIPIVRWGRGTDRRSRDNARGRTGITMTRNATGFVWCVTVPSGLIVVRRHGFAMVCGNCALVAALKLLPDAEGVEVAEEEWDDDGLARRRFWAWADGEGISEPVVRRCLQVPEGRSLGDAVERMGGWNKARIYVEQYAPAILSLPEGLPEPSIDDLYPPEEPAPMGLGSNPVPDIGREPDDVREPASDYNTFREQIDAPAESPLPPPADDDMAAAGPLLSEEAICSVDGCGGATVAFGAQGEPLCELHQDIAATRAEMQGDHPPMPASVKDLTSFVAAAGTELGCSRADISLLGKLGWQNVSHDDLEGRWSELARKLDERRAPALPFGVP